MLIYLSRKCNLKLVLLQMYNIEKEIRMKSTKSYGFFLVSALWYAYAGYASHGHGNGASRRELFNVIQRLSGDIVRPVPSRPRILKEFVCVTANDPTKEERHGHLVFACGLKPCNGCSWLC